MLDYDLVLKSNELFFVGDANSDGNGERATGLYFRDTRHLSHLSLTLDGQPLVPLSVSMQDQRVARVVLTNEHVIRVPDGDILPRTIAVEQLIELDTSLHIATTVRNFSLRWLPFELTFHFQADFRDLFDIRGFHRRTRGHLTVPTFTEHGLRLGYVGLDDRLIETNFEWDQDATVEVDTSQRRLGRQHGRTVLLPGGDLIVSDQAAPVPPPAVEAHFVGHVASSETWGVRLAIEPVPIETSPAPKPPLSLASVWMGEASVTTDNESVNPVLGRAFDDLVMLQTSFPAGTLPAAGIPWFVAPFGRDSLIVGLQTIWMNPARAMETLRVLATLQGTHVDEYRGEEPGKILHEVRYGEMSRTGEIPHTPYYGSVDATPLFAWLFAEAVHWSADEDFYRELLPSVDRALGWIEDYGDRDGDGLVEYVATSPDGVHIVHQGWKDSRDSLNRPNGDPVSGPVALVEVQGYVYAAYARLAELAELYGDSARANELRQRAQQIQQRVEEQFWLEDQGFYAQALDELKRPVAAISSNPGHLLYAGLPRPERAAAVARRFAQPDLDARWGIRTLSSEMATYNPMSYHNGSIWPHDNSLIAAGLRRYGHVELANEIASAIFAVGQADPMHRVPELYCGFARTETAPDSPVSYPVSCSPQAWAAASTFLLIQAMLGARADMSTERVQLDPALPEWINVLTVGNLRAYGSQYEVTVRRTEHGYDVEAQGPVVYAGALLGRS